MYLLDNNKNYNKSMLKKIVEAKNKEELIESFYSKDNNSLDLFFNKIDFCMKHIDFRKNSRSLKNNILNLFKSEPLSLDENNLKEIKNKLNQYNKKNPLTNEIISKEFLSLYKEHLKETISNKDKNAYDIVGNTTKNLNKIFYGFKVINKSDMDTLLLHIKNEQEISIKSINFEDRENKIKEEFFKIRLMANDLNLNLNYKIEEPIDYINKVSDFINSQKKEMKNKYLDLKYNIKKDFVKYYKNDIGFDTLKGNLLNLFTDQETKNYIQKANSIKDISINKILKREDDKLENLKKDFQKINKELINLNENSVINSLYEKKINKEFTKKVNNKSKYIENYIKNKENGFELLSKHLTPYINNEKYSLNELKEFFILNIAKNQELYKLSSNSTIFSNIESNKVIKDYLNKSSDTRMEYVYQILKNKINIERLFTTDININIKDKFYDKLGLTIDDEISKYKLNELYKIFQEKQESLNYKNSNILLGIVLEAYEDKKFNNEKFEKLFNIVKTPINKLTNDDKNLVNQIEDKWIKWSICFNREIKDKSLIYSSINPLTFDYSKFKTIDKIFKDIYGENKNMNRLEVGIYNFIFNEKTKIEDFKQYIKKYNELVNKFMRDNKNIKNQNLRKFLNLVDNSISLINKSDLSNKNVEKIINNIKNDLLDKSKFSHAYNRIIGFPSISNFINNITNNMKDIDIEKILPTIIYIKSLKDKDLQKLILNNKEVFNLFLENPYLQKINNEKIKKYMNYYNTMSQSPTFKNYKEETSLIPIISKDVGNGYSYKVKTIKDFDILLTGEKTKCCMTLNGGAFDIYKYMYENPKENVIFEVYKNGTPVANSWTWIKDNRVCFDNIEILGDELRDSITKAYQDISLEFIVNHGIEETTFGVAHSDININMLGNDIKTNIPNKHLNCYTDSKIQKGILSLNDNIINREEALSKISKLNKDNELFEKYIKLLTKEEKEVKLKEKDEIDDLLNYTKLLVENNNNLEELGSLLSR